MEEIKLICKKCNTEKTIDEMRKRQEIYKSGVQNCCKTCQSKSRHSYYEKKTKRRKEK